MKIFAINLLQGWRNDLVYENIVSFLSQLTVENGSFWGKL